MEWSRGGRKDSSSWSGYTRWGGGGQAVRSQLAARPCCGCGKASDHGCPAGSSAVRWPAPIRRKNPRRRPGLRENNCGNGLTSRDRVDGGIGASVLVAGFSAPRGPFHRFPPGSYAGGRGWALFLCRWPRKRRREQCSGSLVRRSAAKEELPMPNRPLCRPACAGAPAGRPRMRFRLRSAMGQFLWGGSIGGKQAQAEGDRAAAKPGGLRLALGRAKAPRLGFRQPVQAAPCS